MKKEDYMWDYASSYEWMDRINKLPPLIITCSVNGGIQGKETHPVLPETPDEIAEQALEAYNAGASIIHIHGRNPKCLYECCEEAEVYAEINRKVREKCPEIIINNTTGAGLTTPMEARIKCLDARPEMASLNLGPDMSRFQMPPRPEPLPNSHNGMLVDECVPFTYGKIEELAKVMQEKGIKPELETYQPGHYWVSRELINKGLIKPPYVFQFIMGYQTSSFPTPKNLISLIDELPKESLFSVVGIGKFQWAMTTLGIILGGNVRVGLEDNLYLKRGQKLKGNGEAIEKITRIAKEFNREIATPAQAREMYGLSATPRSY